MMPICDECLKEATPYTRGSTPCQERIKRTTGGYPVHAGINLGAQADYICH